MVLTIVAGPVDIVRTKVLSWYKQRKNLDVIKKRPAIFRNDSDVKKQIFPFLSFGDLSLYCKFVIFHMVYCIYSRKFLKIPICSMLLMTCGIEKSNNNKRRRKTLLKNGPTRREMPESRCVFHIASITLSHSAVFACLDYLNIQ